MNLSIYIVCHNQQSFEFFNQDNRFNYVLVGSHDRPVKGMECKKHFIPCLLPDNIEHHKSLLTFTAWYALAKNNLIESDYVGIFEYDTLFYSSPFELDLKQDEITGFIKRQIPDYYYLDCVPYFKNLLSEKEKEIALRQLFWSATSNFIMPVKFLHEFTGWYMNFVPDILKAPNHPHFHERAINVFAANNDYTLNTVKLIEHKQLCSHNNKVEIL